MKTTLTSLCTGLLLATAICAQAGEATQPQAQVPSSPEFTRMKSLVGTWQGKTDMGQGPIDLTVEYRLIAGGTVLQEKVFAGTPNEMLTMYYEKDGKLTLTHYCVLGNRPGMVLGSSDPKTLRFAFDQNCGINPAKESHMNALTVTFDDSETITTSCKAIVDGKPMPEHATTLKRIKVGNSQT